jgi:phosphoglycolate phosphatase-like HAD superfamily hydrolase
MHQAAMAAGMRAIGVSWGAHDQAHLSGLFEEVVADVGELRDALQRMGIGAAMDKKTGVV